MRIQILKLIISLGISFPFLMGCNNYPGSPPTTTKAASSATDATETTTATATITTSNATTAKVKATTPTTETTASGNHSIPSQAQTGPLPFAKREPESKLIQVDQNWVANPKNYMRTYQPHLNKSISVPILEYHEANYVPGDIATLKPGEFLSQLQWLYGHGFHTINFGQLYAAMYYGYKLPSRPILLTFDDGYESIYFKVYPLLKKYHDEATLFIVSNFTHDQPNRTVNFPTLTKSELIEMQSSGLVDIESHTIDHKDLSTLADKQAVLEIAGSAAFLEEIVHHKIVFFCYPDGGYTSRTITIVKNANYLLAVTQNQGYANIDQGPFALKRISILDYTTLADFDRELEPSLK